MRNTLAGLAALVILAAVLGGARSWYSVGGLPADPGKFAFRVEFDAPKIGTDVTDSLRWVHGLVSRSDKEVSDEKLADKKEPEKKEPEKK